MSEGEVVEQLVEFTTILLAGVSVLFTVVSAYVAALNYFVGAASFAARFFSFAFVCLVIGFLMFVMAGAQGTQIGLVARLGELQASGELSAAGRAILANSKPNEQLTAWLGLPFSIDEVVRVAAWTTMSLIFVVLFYLTFLHQWRPDVFNVKLQNQDQNEKVVR